jgi:ABC-type glycerol-3-phosphate transport system substrate-binding protein
MKMKRIAVAVMVGLSIALAGCAQLKNAGAVIGAVETASTTTVPISSVVAAENAYDILKQSAASFAAYCVNAKNQPAACSVSVRRQISRAIDAGDAARAVVDRAARSGESVTSAVYNTLVAAVQTLQGSPVASFTGG